MSKLKEWCAYCPLEGHCDGVEDPPRSALRNLFPGVEIAMYEDAKAWVEAYEVDKAASQTTRKQGRGPALKTNGVGDRDSGPDTDDDFPLAMVLKAFR